MKQLILILTICITSAASYGQRWSNEFHVYPSGLIYSDSTMGRLKFIVDSLQLRFRHCDLSRDYYSVRQGRGHAIRMNTGNIKAVLDDIQREIPYEDLVKKYPLAQTDSFVLLTEDEYEDKDGKILMYTSQTHSSDWFERLEVHENRAIDTTKWGIYGRKGNWIFAYTRKVDYMKEGLEAFYLPEQLSMEKMPDIYARLVLYTDCMTDTGTTVYYKDANRSGRWTIVSKKTGKPVADGQTAFWEYVDGNTKEFVRRSFPKKLKLEPYQYDSVREVFIKDSLSSRPLFHQLLDTAVEDALRSHRVTSGAFEYYTEMYYAKSAALRMKRNRRVIGSCSMDQAPRTHAMQIALLAAETADWSVFLKAHLDIMNDRFERRSDGSYAWGTRKTYLKELEDLDIDVTDLLLGISLRIGNPSENHYFGNIGRLGRALVESRDRAQMEEKILAMIRDTALDDYNRLIQHYLFLNYIYYLPEKESRLASLGKLEAADKTMPAYILPRLKIDREGVEKGANNSL